MYANSETCAIACTGHGETFLKNSTAFNIHSLIKHTGITCSEAINQVIMNELPAHTGGCVGVSADAVPYATYNTSGMFTGISDWTGRVEVYHKEGELANDAALELRIVPDIINSFESKSTAGALKVLYCVEPGRTSKARLLVAVGPTIACNPVMLVSEPKVWWTPPASDTEDGLKMEREALFTLIMVQTPSDSPDQKLGWMICDIPGNDMAEGKTIVPYSADPTEGDSPTSTGVFQYIFLLLEQQAAPRRHSAVVYTWGMPFNSRKFMADRGLTFHMGNFCTTAIDSQPSGFHHSPLVEQCDTATD